MKLHSIGRHIVLKELDDFTRYQTIVNWLIEICVMNEVKAVMFENYSYGSKSSRLAQIAENTGICKYRLQIDFHIPVYTVPPKTIKKFATRKW